MMNYAIVICEIY